MHAYVHCSTVHNNKDMESTQMLISDRLDKENVVHIHHGILCCHKKEWGHILCRNMDETGSHHPQQTNTETKTKHHMFSLIGGNWIMRTCGYREGSTKHCGLLGGKGEGQQWGKLGRDSLGRNAKWGWRGKTKQNTLPCVYLCNCLACSAHVPQNLKCNKKF